MIPITQTILHDPENGKHGNCLSAVLASLLHLDIETIPVFNDPDTWVKDLNAWLRPYGLAYLLIQNFDRYADAYGVEGCYHELSGPSPRGTDTFHAVVAKDAQAIFDPHPDRTGIKSVETSGLFISLEPWRIAQMMKGTV